MEPQYVHVSLGQFEATAIQKLIARGIREDVARAFVTEGLRKQNGYDRYKEIVCKAKFHSFFVHKPDEGVMVPTVLERKTNKFKAPFSMTGREKAELMSSFPELDVSCDGTIRNSHAFYANKRLAECELLISLVWASAVADGTLDPRSVVDVGGNQTQHINRGRGHVHCDTPVLSAKDIYRYTVREVYSGVDPSSVCNKSFHSCPYKADFGIGVHSTYDLSPQSIAEGMCHREMKVFFGVVNIHPGLSHLTSGEYIHDGMVLRVTSNEVSYGFVHDTSLVYTHSKAVMSSYLHSSLSLPVKTPQGTKWYLFKHHSVRGATIVFSVTEVDTPSAVGTTISTGARANKYRIVMDKTDIPFDVDVEMFDRLVLMAAASRKIDEYNITALFKYAKSLRQRISINSIVLSSGFREDTSILVKMTVAAMAVASAYHYESARFFQSQTRNMMRRRNKSLMFQVFDISTGFVSLAVDTVSSIIGLDSAFNSLQEWANSLLKAGNSVRIEVATIKDFGCRFDNNVLGPVHAQLGKPDDTEWFTGVAVDYPDDQLNWSTMFYTTLTDSKILGHEHYNPSCLAGYGYRATYPPELVVSKCKSTVKRLFGISSMRLRATATRDVLYKAYLNQCPVEGETSGKIRHLDNGDSVVHVMTRDPDDPSVPVQHCFIAFRGVGSKYILCERPSYYSSRCIAFVLFFEEDITEMAHLTACGQFNAETLPNPLYSILKHCASHLQYLGQTEGIAFNDAVTGKTSLSIITKRNLQTGSHFGGVGTRPEIIENTPVLRNTQWAQMEAVSQHVFDDPEAFMSTDEDSDDDGVLGVEAEAMANNSVGSGDSDDISRVAFSAPEKELRGGRSRAGRSVKSAPAGVASGRVVSGTSEHSAGTAVLPAVGSPSGESSGTADEAVEQTTTTDHFYTLLKHSKGKDPARRNWGSDSTSSVSVAPGFNAIAELLRWAEESSTHALSVGRRCVDFAVSAIKQDLSAREWHGIQSGLEGDVQICELDSAGVLVEYYTKDRLTHMAVTDGEDIYVVGSLPPGSGPFVTYRDLEIWTVSSIISVASRCMFSEYQCPVELVQGPAGCGKTTEICNKISDSDFGMCETKAAARDTADRLRRAGRSVAETFCTVDSFLINKAQNFSGEVDTLFIDECLRLHAGKIWCLIKIMKPRRVVCYGDPKQIPLLPFTPDFEFSHSVFPWSSVSTLKRTFRLPGDITMMLVESGYYDYKFKTHNKVVHGFKGVKQFYPGIFKDKPEGVVVLTYTKAAADDLRVEGIAPVMTIGESQGKDLDDVWLYRESDLAKDIYYNREQTLTAITRVKRSFSFIPVSPFDDSEIQSLIKLLDDPVISATVASYMESG